MAFAEKKKKIMYGLSDSEVKQSYEKYGNNQLAEKKRKTFLQRYVENFRDPIIRILLISLLLHAIFSFGHIDWFETGGIILAIFLSTAVSTISEHGSQNAFAKMQKSSQNGFCRVIRNGTLQEIAAKELVRGDVLVVSAGETVPADGIVLGGRVMVDQSALNGESQEVEKYPCSGAYSQNLGQQNLLFRGSILLSGECTMEVARGGNDTLYGKIANELQEEARESPLRFRLNHLAKQISVIGYISALVVAVVYLVNAIGVANHFDPALIADSLTNPKVVLPTLLHAFTLAITIVVVAVPEGLPMMITVVLSSNMKRMIEDCVLVKKMVGIETAGSMNLLLCDKTGTLTAGKMKVEKFIFGDGNETAGFLVKQRENAIQYLLSMNAFYNTDSTIIGTEVSGGNQTDRSILSFFKNYDKAEATVVHKFPFDSRFRYAAVHLQEKERYSLIKGAPELLLPKSSYYLNAEGRVIAFDDKTKTVLRKKWHDEAEKGHRLLAVCASYDWKSNITDYDHFVFLAFICIKDSLRKDAKSSVETLQKAGIQVVMITGDNKDTAISIAEECGILHPTAANFVVTGNELANMTDDELAKVLPKLRVVARALPSDKSRLVKVAQRAGHIVGMTGDGINDASALKVADVGFSMGQGTDIAKEASDIVLVDGSIHSIVKTVLYGRTIFHSIRKFICFQLMMNLCAVGVSIVGQYVGIESPITIVQMLWVNMIMDTLGGLAFAGEPPLSSYLTEKPKPRNASLINGSMLNQIVFSGGYVLLLCGLFLGLPYFRNTFGFANAPLAYLTSFFVLFIFAGVFTCFNVRTERINILANLSQNKPFLLIMLFISLVQITMVCLGGAVFRTVPIAMQMWCKLIILAFSVIPIEALRKSLWKLSKK